MQTGMVSQGIKPSLKRLYHKEGWFKMVTIQAVKDAQE